MDTECRFTGSDIMNDEVEEAVAVLKRGGTIVYPTETVLGLGCDATNDKAVARVLEIKHRPESKALIVLVDSISMLERYAVGVSDVALQLIEASVDPITIVYDGAIGLAKSLLAADGTVGIRVTSHPTCRALIRKLRRPIVSTSANLSGEAPARSLAELSKEISSGVDYVMTNGCDEASKMPARKPSTVIRLKENGEIKILRK